MLLYAINLKEKRFAFVLEQETAKDVTKRIPVIDSKLQKTNRNL